MAGPLEAFADPLAHTAAAVIQGHAAISMKHKNKTRRKRVLIGCVGARGLNWQHVALGALSHNLPKHLHKLAHPPCADRALHLASAMADITRDRPEQFADSFEQRAAKRRLVTGTTATRANLYGVYPIH